MKQICVINTIFFSIFLFGCGSNGQRIREAKLNCYKDKLREIADKPIYIEVMSQFIDTFSVMKGEKEYFGIPEIVSNKIDEAIFFNENNTECILIVLEKYSDQLVFGEARMISGTLLNRRWVFEPSINITYEKDFFSLYRENNFENISKLARYTVLTTGEVKKRECDIDKEYWFKELKK